LNSAGRGLQGSIYYDGFILQSSGNYYLGNEAYLNHTSNRAAQPSPSVALPPKHIPPSHSRLNKSGLRDFEDEMARTQTKKTTASVEKIRKAAEIESTPKK
jgi:hypothetical protein